MPEIELTDAFIKFYENLPPEIKKKVKKALRLLAENPRHPSLQTKPVEGAPGIYEARVDQRYHLTYERLAGDVLRMRVVGKHDTALKKP
ncbi:MAG: type II toxin-antitoxin system RelE family toxin [Anaerolineales bacterium]